ASRHFTASSRHCARNSSICQRSCSVIKKFVSPTQNNGPSLDTLNRHRLKSACALATGRSCTSNSTQTNVGSTSLCCRCSRRWSSIRFRVRVFMSLRPREHAVDLDLRRLQNRSARQVAPELRGAAAEDRACPKTQRRWSRQRRDGG